MSIQISILCLILFRMIIIIGCAPKIGREHLDPLIFKQNIIDDNDALYKIQSRRKYLVAKDNNTQEKVKIPCFGYDFDNSKCKHVNNRILCGYNKNLGEQKVSDEGIDMGNGCRLRGERIECGYGFKPFINIRRPTANGPETYNEHKESAVNQKVNIIRRMGSNNDTLLLTKLTKGTTIKKVANPSTLIISTLSTSKKEKEITNKKNLALSSTITPTDINITELPKTNSIKTTSNKATHRISKKWNSNCVEKNDYIVCYDIP